MMSREWNSSDLQNFSIYTDMILVLLATIFRLMLLHCYATSPKNFRPAEPILIKLCAKLGNMCKNT